MSLAFDEISETKTGKFPACIYVKFFTSISCFVLRTSVRNYCACLVFLFLQYNEQR